MACPFFAPSRRLENTVWLRPPHAARVQGAAAGIYDGNDPEGELPGLVAALSPAPVVALVDFPRIEDQRRAVAAGAAAVLAKPLQVDDLLWQLAEAATASRT